MEFWNTTHVNTRRNILLAARINPFFAQYNWEDMPGMARPIIGAWVENKKKDIIFVDFAEKFE